MSKAENKEPQGKSEKLLSPQSGGIEEIFSVKAHRAVYSNKAYVCSDQELWKILPQVEAKEWQEKLWGPEDFEIHLSSSYSDISGCSVPYEQSESKSVGPNDFLLKIGRILYQIEAGREMGKVITARLIIMENYIVRLKFFFSFCNEQCLLPEVNLLPGLSIYPEDPTLTRAVTPIFLEGADSLIPLVEEIFQLFSRISEGDPVDAQKFTDAIKKLIDLRYHRCQNLSSYFREQLPSGITYDTTVLKEYRNVWKQTFFASFRETSPNSFEKGITQIIWDYIP